MILSSSEFDDENVAQDNAERFSRRQADPNGENLDIVAYALIMDGDYLSLSLANGNTYKSCSFVRSLIDSFW